ncbi:50S ribosomal protein L29 [Candidatus Roizmanbacteria bacterium]|nr:50S ribosomal protein L29 [Candidatus Roizmanbacteria bacterium]
MKKLVKEIKDKTINELEKQIVLSVEEIAKLKLSEKSTPVKDSNSIAKKRKHLAVLLTVLSEKKEVESLQNKKV